MAQPRPFQHRRTRQQIVNYCHIDGPGVGTNLNPPAIRENSIRPRVTLGTPRNATRHDPDAEHQQRKDDLRPRARERLLRCRDPHVRLSHQDEDRHHEG